ncbi:MAG TPA: proton-conducting transporter membrane subunit [Solirubrobacteraceae bacterium]|nr:proton-conducting transporter membrane subunit [Solirubrobacteraceae bacterium]
MSWTLYAILAVPLAAVAISLLADWRISRMASMIAAAITFALTIAIAIKVAHGDSITTAHAWIRIDSLGAVFLLATGLLYAMAAVFSIGYLAADEARPAFDAFARRYWALLNLFAWTMVLVPLAADFGTLWVAVELTTIVSALLVAIDRTDAAIEASWKYVLIASSGLGIALLAMIVLYAAGTHDFGGAYVPRITRFLIHGSGLSKDAVDLAFVLALVGFGTKVGLVPMHTWLPDAHSEAPAPVSAMLSGSLLAGALYAVLRFFQVAVVVGEAQFAERVLIVFGLLSVGVAALFVLRQGNYKRLLAYSSIEHMGVIAVGIGFGAPLAIAGALLHVITHASAKGLAFLGSGSLLRGYDTKEVDGVSDAGRRMPWTGPMFLAAALALCGLPLSGVFRSEFQIVVGGLGRGGGFVDTGAALLLVFVNLAFFGIVWHAGRMVLKAGVVESGEKDEGGGESAAGAAVGERSVWMVAGMLGCLFVSVALGLHLPGDLQALLSNAGHRLQVP